MKTQTEIIATTVEVVCPYCNERLDGFFGDPRGSKVECDYCNKVFRIHEDADVEIY